MVKAKASFFGSANLATIWSVDDAWFEGVGDIQPSLDVLVSLDTKNENEANRRIGKDKNEYDHSFKELRNIIESDAFQQNLLSGDFLYFKILAELCIKNNLRLALCNFEYLEQEFNNVNKGKNAILLDIHYALEPQGNSNGYGINLLQKLIQGKRPRSDIFFVTGYLQELESFLANQNNPNWWLIRSLPHIRKELNLEQELEQFVNYFTQRFQKLWKEILQEFCEALIAVYSSSKINPEKYTHPHHFNDIDNICNFSLLKNYFEPLNNDKESQYMDSFKALYHYWEADNHKIEGEYEILTEIFIQHLNYINIKVKSENLHHKENSFVLPVQPGMLFLINFIYFLITLNYEHKDEPVIIFESNSLDNGRKQEVILKIKLDYTKSPEALKNAIITGNREATEAFRQLVACKEEIFVDFVRSDKEYATHLADKWKIKKILPGSGKVYRQLINYDFEGDYLILKWSHSLKSKISPV